MYQMNANNGYIISLVKGVSVGNIDQALYECVLSVLGTCPVAPNGYYYRLKTDLAWELCEILPVTDEEDGEPATIADYEAALAELGVEV